MVFYIKENTGVNYHILLRNKVITYPPQPLLFPCNIFNLNRYYHY